jgi:hypothetical protein
MKLKKTEDSTIETKKRGRKVKAATEGSQVILSEQIQPTRVTNHVILHLKCTMDELKQYIIEQSTICMDPLIYNPNIVLGSTHVTSYNDINSNLEFSVYESDDMDLATSQTGEDAIQTKLKRLKISLYKNTLSPDKNSDCFWCTFPFTTSPCYIPKYELNGTYYCYGCFCSPECGVAYLMKDKVDESTKFERYCLLNKIYANVYGYTENIRSAPDPHYTLHKFYGELSIIEYRKLLKTPQQLTLIEKPMTRVLPELHDEYSNRMNNQYKVKRASEYNNEVSKMELLRNKFTGRNA